ncbi:MAG: prenyltransferase [Anaerolineales bacterium]
MSFNAIRLFIKLSRPLFLLGAALVYALGVGIAHYLGASIGWGLYILGQAWVTTLQLATHYFNEYFDAPADAANQNRTFFSGGSGALGEAGLPREIALWAGIAALTAATSFTIMIMRTVGLNPALLLTMVLIFFGAIFYSMPPIRLAESGYGELTTSILVASLVPALAFILQYGKLHRLVAMSTFPLIALHLAMMLAFELPDYAVDLKYEKQTLMVRLGWERGMQLHNILILSAYLLIGVAMLLGYPTSIAIPALLSLPLGLFQIWYMTRIAGGAKPNWNLLGGLAVLVFGVTAYLITFSFWIR